MEAMVPRNLVTVEGILDLLQRFADPSIATYINPVKVSGNRLVFDLKWFVNVAFLSDFYVPLRPERCVRAELMAHQLWDMMIGGGRLPQGFAEELFDCIDTSRRTSEKLEQELLRLVHSFD